MIPCKKKTANLTNSNFPKKRAPTSKESVDII
jgi:hypothetical protein